MSSSNCLSWHVKRLLNGQLRQSAHSFLWNAVGATWAIEWVSSLGRVPYPNRVMWMGLRAGQWIKFRCMAGHGSGRSPHWRAASESVCFVRTGQANLAKWRETWAVTTGSARSIHYLYFKWAVTLPRLLSSAANFSGLSSCSDRKQVCVCRQQVSMGHRPLSSCQAG